MKILFYTGEDEFTSPREEIDDEASTLPETLVFKDTELAHAERDSDGQMSATLYTKGNHFYVTLDREDLYKIIGLAVKINSKDETQAPVHIIGDSDLALLGLAVMTCYEHGHNFGPHMWPEGLEDSVTPERLALEHELVEAVLDSVRAVANNVDTWKALGAMVLAYQNTKDYFSK